MGLIVSPLSSSASAVAARENELAALAPSGRLDNLSPQEALASADAAAFERSLLADPDLADSPLLFLLAQDCVRMDNAPALRVALRLFPKLDSQTAFFSRIAVERASVDCLADLEPRLWSNIEREELFMTAASGQSVECLEILSRALSSGFFSRPHLLPHGGAERTALMMSAERGSLAVLEWLLPRSDPNFALPSGHTALTLAAQAGNADNVRALLPFCDPNHRLALGSTALILAAGNGQMDVIEILAPVSNLRARNQLKFSALAAAARNDHAEAADFLACLDPTSLAARPALEMLGPERMPQYAAWRERSALLREVADVRAAQRANCAAGDSESAESAKGEESTGRGRETRRL